VILHFTKRSGQSGCSLVPNPATRHQARVSSRSLTGRSHSSSERAVRRSSVGPRQAHGRWPGHRVRQTQTAVMSPKPRGPLGRPGVEGRRTVGLGGYGIVARPGVGEPGVAANPGTVAHDCVVPTWASPCTWASMVLRCVRQRVQLCRRTREDGRDPPPPGAAWIGRGALAAALGGGLRTDRC
jgi:hypothetical protein